MKFVFVSNFLNPHQYPLSCELWRQNADVRQGYYLILLGAMIFIMRGDLMSSLAYTVGIMVSYSLCVWLTTTFRFSRIRLH